MKVIRVIKSIFTAATSKGEIKEEEDPGRVVFIVFERLPILYIVTGPGHSTGIFTITQQPFPGEVPSVTLPS